jgi:hypothetical protein
VRRIRVSLLLGCLLAVAGVVVATPASACSCAGGTTQQLFDRADAVFTGSLVSREVDHSPGPAPGLRRPRGRRPGARRVGLTG